MVDGNGLAMEQTEGRPAGRKPWRVDLKWVFGILFVLFFGPAFLMFNLFQVTTDENAQKVVVPIVEEAFGISELVDANYDEIIAAAKEAPREDISGAFGLSVELGLDGREVAGLNRQELKRQLSLAIYRLVRERRIGELNNGFFFGLNGGEIEEGQSEADVFFQGVIDAMGMFFNEEGHGVLQIVMIVGLVISLVFAIPFFVFSFRFGKMVSLGAAFLVVSFGPFLILNFLNNQFEIGGLDWGAGVVESLGEMVAIFEQNYFLLFIVGLILFFGGILIGGIYRAVKGGGDGN